MAAPLRRQERLSRRQEARQELLQGVRQMQAPLLYELPQMQEVLQGVGQAPAKRQVSSLLAPLKKRRRHRRGGPLGTGAEAVQGQHWMKAVFS